MRTFVLVLGALLGYGGLAYADMKSEHYMFEDIDDDGDKFISRQEAGHRDDLRANFQRIDKNSDGKLDISEFSAFEAEDRFATPDVEEAEPGAAPF